MTDVAWLISTVITVTLLAVAVTIVPMWVAAFRPEHVENRYRLVARWYGVAIIVIGMWRTAAWADLATSGDSTRVSQEVSWGLSLLSWTVVMVITLVCGIGYFRVKDH